MCKITHQIQICMYIYNDYSNIHNDKCRTRSPPCRPPPPASPSRPLRSPRGRASPETGATRSEGEAKENPKLRTQEFLGELIPTKRGILGEQSVSHNIGVCLRNLLQLQSNTLERKRVRIYFGVVVVFFFFPDFLGLFSFFVRASKMSYFTACSRKIHAFYSSPPTSPASFSTSPACPTTSPTSREEQNQKSSWRVDGVKKMMIQIGGHFNPCKKN